VNKTGLEKSKMMIAISIIVYIGTLISSLFSLISFPYLYMHANYMYSGSYVFFFPVALSGIILVNNIFRYMQEKYDFSILEYIGKYSMNFYVTHWILLVIMTFVVKMVLKIESADFLFYILLLSCITGLPFINVILNKNRTE
jgi:hypothetical protein